MRDIDLFLMLWLYHLLPATVLSLPIWLRAHDRAKWLWWDFSILVLPYSVWAVFFALNLRPKSMGNFGEALYLGCIIPLAAVIRAAVGSKIKPSQMAGVVLVAFCTIAFLLYWFMPIQPE